MVNAPLLVALVRTGATFVNGKLEVTPAEESEEDELEELVERGQVADGEEAEEGADTSPSS